MTKSVKPNRWQFTRILLYDKTSDLFHMWWSKQRRVVSPESRPSAGCWLKACMADGAGRGKKGEPEPYSAEGTFSGLIAMYFPLSPSPFSSLQAPTPSNRAERYAVPFRVRPHPAQLGRVAVHGRQSDHQRVQYGGAGGHGRVHPVGHVQRLGVRCMIRETKKKELKQKEKRYFTGKWTWEKKTYDISRMKKGPIRMNN